MNNNQDMNVNSQTNNFINNQPYQPNTGIQNQQNINIPNNNQMPNNFQQNQPMNNNPVNPFANNQQTNNMNVPNNNNQIITNSQPNLQNNLVNNNQPNQMINNTNGTINPFANNQQANNPVNQGYREMLKKEGINVQNQSRFINGNSFNETSINDLNVEGDYNNFNKIDYRNDPKVMENLQEIKKEKKTITITEELKFIIVIALGLFIFILVMPYIFDFINNIKG